MEAVHRLLFRVATLLVLAFVGLGAPVPSRAAPVEPTSAPDVIVSPFGPTNSMTEIDDLTDWYVKGICFGDQDYGYGFIKGGPEAGWKESADTDLTRLDHAFYTLTGTSWGDSHTNNWAWWAPRLPNDGRWQVEAFIPRVVTNRADTSAARYRIWTGSAPQYSTISQAANANRWVSLGTYDFTKTTEPVLCGIGGPYVELLDVTTDGGSQPSILFDAIRWVEPITVKSYLPDIQEGDTVDVGDSIRLCYEVSRQVDIKWLYCYPNCLQKIVPDGPSNGTGDCKTMMGIKPPAGKRIARIEAWRDGQRIASDDASFNVREPGPDPRVDIWMEGGCDQTKEWGERYDYHYKSNVQGHVEVYECSGDSACRFLQQADVTPGVEKSGNTFGTVKAGPHRLEARLTTRGVTSRCDYTLKDRVPTPPPCTDRASFLLIPPWVPTVKPGEILALDFTVRNDGSCTWLPGQYYAQTTINQLGIPDRFELTENISPGEKATFRFDVHAPQTTGDYILEWVFRHGTETIGGPVSAGMTVVLPKHVAVFVHGWLELGDGNGCSAIPGKYDGHTGNEWGKLSNTLTQNGYRVYFAHWESRPGYTSGVEEAANCLFTQIEWIKKTEKMESGDKITLIAHSMGGLVSRAYIESGQDRGDVDKLITFGSPHLGVAFEGLMKVMAIYKSKSVFAGCEKDPGTCDLSIESVRDFNQTHGRDPGTEYDLVGGTWEWPLSMFLVERPHDGIIPLRSATGLGGPHVQTWETNDTHTTWPGPDPLGLNGRSYMDSDASVACLRKFLKLGGGSTTCLAKTSQAQTTGRLAQSVDQPPRFTETLSGDILSYTTQEAALSLEGRVATIYLSTSSPELEFSLYSPDGKIVTRRNIADLYPGGQYTESPLPSGGVATAFTLPNPESGRWRVAFRNTSGKVTRYLLFASLQSTISLDVEWHLQASPSPFVEVHAALADGSNAISGSTVTLKVERAGGMQTTRMVEATKGNYVAIITAAEHRVLLTVTADGETANHTPFTRETNQTLYVLPPSNRPEEVFLPVLRNDLDMR